MKSTKEVGYSFFSAGATTGMPMRPVVGLGVTVDWAKDGGKYDVTKTVGSNIVGSAIEAKLGSSFATPYLREAGTNVFDKVYDTLGKENNEKNDFIEIIKMSIFLILMATLYSLYKFNFDFTKIKILPILKWYPTSFVCVLVGFYLSRFLKNGR